MAGVISTFHQPCNSPLLPRTFKPLSFHLHTLSLRTRSPNPYPSLSISARYNRRVGAPRRSNPSEDETLDFSLLKSDNVRLIDQQQNMVGIISKSQAFQMAEDAELDLVIVSTESDPPVVRIMDYNKYKYEQQKKKRDQQKKSAASCMDLKEVKMGYNIDIHDYNLRLKAARKFLKDGDKVKVIVFLKKRKSKNKLRYNATELIKLFRNNAIELIRRFQNDIGELAVEEAKNFSDRNIFIVLVPNKAAVQKSQEPPKKTDNSVANEVSASV